MYTDFVYTDFVALDVSLPSIRYIEIRARDEGITHVLFSQNPPSTLRPHPQIEHCKRQLDEYFRGVRQEFDLPLAVTGTAFQQRVWAELRAIPYGRTASYGEIAARIGQPQSQRAVGAANGRNPIAIIVPCHRVIGGSGKLTGYAGGLDRKAWLLNHEAGIKQLV